MLLGSCLALVLASSESFAQIQLLPRDPPPEPAAAPDSPPPGRSPSEQDGSRAGARAAKIPRDSEPAVRPDRLPALDVQELDALSLDAIGVDAAAGGLGSGIWRGSDPDLVLWLLAELPVETVSQPLRHLQRRLLSTGAPVGAGRGDALFAARIDRLFAMGEIATAKSLLDQLPSSSPEDPLAQTLAEVGLLTGDDHLACRPFAAGGRVPAAPFWSKLRIYCRLAANDPAGAGLGLDLLRDTGYRDQAFYDLAALASLSPDRPTGELAIGTPDAFHLALLRRLKLPLPTTAFENAPPALRAAVLADERLRAKAPLAFLETALLQGLIEPAAFQRVFASLPADGTSVGETGELLDRIEHDWSARTRMTLRLALDREEAKATKAAWLAAAWQAAAGTARPFVATYYADAFSALSPEPDLTFAAPAVGRALLALGKAPLVRGWLDLLTRGSTPDDRRASLQLRALLAMPGAEQVGRIGALVTEAWLGDEGDHGAAGAQVERLLSMQEGIGEDVLPSAWHRLLAPPLPTDAATPAPPIRLWRGLGQAAEAGRLGETVLFALHMLDGRPEAAHPEALHQSLKALRRVGLGAEARAIALHAALAAGL